ncbi:RseA family anti-sigma factor [Thorsellia kenyensis]|uniref:RseA family anti-sigma factor n=1 Tax=Thorsellia kenyensis TaxID=1549888 RepID=A0ABV6C922_9GAMM
MQKEALSALMDGEISNHQTANSLINKMNKDADLRNTWSRYHLMRDTLRAEVANSLKLQATEEQFTALDIADKVAERLKDEPIIFNGSTQAKTKSSKSNVEPKRRLNTFGQNVLQFGLAASFAFALIIGVQQINKSDAENTLQFSENPTFNTLPIIGEATAVSLGVPGSSSDSTHSISQRQLQIQEQRQRINALLQDYELQKRLGKNQSEPTKSEVQVGLSVPGTQKLGEELISTQ